MPALARKLTCAESSEDEESDQSEYEDDFKSSETPDTGGLTCSTICDVADLIGASIWLVGCVCFLPEQALDPAKYLWGCVFFIIGEVIYIAIGVRSLLQAQREAGIWSADAWDGIGCIVGGTGFFIGTVLFLPEDLASGTSITWLVDLVKKNFIGSSTLLNLPGDAEKVQEAGPLFEGAMCFIVGALGFSFSTFFNSMGLRNFVSLVDRLTAASSILHIGGGLMFCLGSMGFIAQVGCGNRMVAFGAWSFVVGCMLYIGGALAAIVRDGLTCVDRSRSRTALHEH